jgi:Predicted membrane protein (DUF2306)
VFPERCAARSFTWETVVQSGLLMTTTGIGLYFALRRRITQHRQWMIRSYAAALTFLEIRVILGLTGWDHPLDWHVLEHGRLDLHGDGFADRRYR